MNTTTPALGQSATIRQAQFVENFPQLPQLPWQAANPARDLAITVVNILLTGEAGSGHHALRTVSNWLYGATLLSRRLYNDAATELLCRTGSKLDQIATRAGDPRPALIALRDELEGGR